MKTKLAVLLLILLGAGGSLFAQEGTPVKSLNGSGVPNANLAHIIGTQYIDISTSPPTVYVCSAVTLTPTVTQCTWTAVGSTTSPSSLTTYFNRFLGLAPQDFGAKGDSHWFGDCGMATNTHVTCPTSTPFKSTDVGKVFEITSSATTPITVIAGTITAFNSSSDVTTDQTAGTTFTNQRFRYGTDDNAAIQSWAAAIIAALGSNGSLPTQVRGGYIPQGIYHITQPIRLVLPTSVGTGECGPSGGLAGSAGGIGFPCNLWIVGDGFFSSQFWVATAGKFNWGSGASNTGVFYVTGAAGPQQASVQLNNFGIVSDGSAHNTSAVTGLVGGLFFDGTTHDNVSQMLVQDFHNTTNNLLGMIVNCGFESAYQQSALEGSDINLRIDSNVGGVACAGIANESGVTGKLVFDSDFLESPGFAAAAATNVGQNLQIGSGAPSFTAFHLRFRNIHVAAYGVGNEQAGININAVTTPANDHIEFSSCRINENTNSVGGIVLNGAATVSVELHGCDITTTATNAINSVDANATFKAFGGNIQGTIANAGTGILTQVGGNPTLSGTGTTFVNSVGVAFVNLPAAANGSTIGCTNCTAASNPCTGASTGAVAVRQNGAWVCK